MGKKKYLEEIESLFRKSPVVDSDSISRLIKSRKKVKQYNKQLIRNLLLAGKIKRLTKGFYTISDEISLAVFCFKPAYLGLQDALSIHNLWEQETIPVIITTRKVRQGIRKISDANLLIRRINKKYFFGYTYIIHGNFYFPVSDVEKTFIDMIYFKEKMDKELLNNIKKIVKKKKIESYLRGYPKSFQKIVANGIKY